MQQSGMARAYGKLNVRERTQAVIQAGSRGDCSEAERMLTAGPSGPVLAAERAFRETLLRYAVGLNGLLGRREGLAEASDMLPLVLIACSEAPVPEPMITQPLRVLEGAQEALRQRCCAYLKGMDHFCRQIACVSALQALAVYLPNVATELQDIEIGAECLAGHQDEETRILQDMLSTWRFLMGAAVS